MMNENESRLRQRLEEAIAGWRLDRDLADKRRLTQPQTHDAILAAGVVAAFDRCIKEGVMVLTRGRVLSARGGDRYEGGRVFCDSPKCKGHLVRVVDGGHPTASETEGEVNDGFAR